VVVMFSSPSYFPCRDGVTKLAHVLVGKKSDSTPVIMICGLSGVMEDWLDFPLVLSKKRQIALFDNRFLGRSFVANAPSYRWRDQYEAVVDLADHLGWKTFHLIGWSMGGMIAQAVSSMVPQRVASLVLIGSGASWQPETPPGSFLLFLFFLLRFQSLK